MMLQCVFDDFETGFLTGAPTEKRVSSHSFHLGRFAWYGSPWKVLVNNIYANMRVSGALWLCSCFSRHPGTCWLGWAGQCWSPSAGVFQNT